MTERPILFKGAMVRAILNGTKNQTRRPLYVLTKNVEKACFDNRYPPSYGNGEWPNHAVGESWTLSQWRKAQPGDLLWVRETYFAFGRWETRFSAKKARDEWHFVDMTVECGHQYGYAADGHYLAPHRRTGGVSPTWWKRPAIFMPRAASRITREVVSVRVERLQDISEADAIAEGVSPAGGMLGDDDIMVSEIMDRLNVPAPVARYVLLWDSINGEPGKSWSENPWVLRIEFKP